MPKLSVNIDHIATLRQARKTIEPDPVYGAVLIELAGAYGITVHLREDRRHIQDRDLYVLKEIVKIELNLEMAATNEMVKIATSILPTMVTLVPEKREELTTEGGLDIIKNEKELSFVIKKLKEKNILVSIFIDPDPLQIKKAAKISAQFIEIHTGKYANMFLENNKENEKELKKIKEAVILGKELGLKVNAGHGLTYTNVSPIAQIKDIEILAIGHSIISRAVFIGLENAVKEMLSLINHGY